MVHLWPLESTRLSCDGVGQIPALRPRVWPRDDPCDRYPQMNQLSFNFDPPEKPEPKPEVTPLAVVSSPPSLEPMAQQLEQHPDYRVLRRLVPNLNHGQRAGAPGANSTGADAPWVLILDTETTGLSHATDKIIELAMLLVQVDAASGLPFGPVTSCEGL